MTLVNTKGCADCWNSQGTSNKVCITCRPDPATNRGTNFVRCSYDFVQNTTKEADSVNHPSHYTRNPIEALKIIKMTEALDEDEDGEDYGLNAIISDEDRKSVV